MRLKRSNKKRRQILKTDHALSEFLSQTYQNMTRRIYNNHKFVQKVAKEDVFECVLKTLKELKDQEKLNKL